MSSPAGSKTIALVMLSVILETSVREILLQFYDL